MQSMNYKIKNCIFCNDNGEIVNLLTSGLNPNYEGGWPIRFAARQGCYNIVKTLIQYGANPHLLSESGASTLQLAVFSGGQWDSDNWTFLLSCCDSSQLADGAAVAIIFNNISALKAILATGRCNTNIPTTLTGRTVEQLAKGYKMQYLLTALTIQNNQSNITPNTSPRNTRENGRRNTSEVESQRALSPSVARFFNQTARQSGLTPPRVTSAINALSPRLERV